MTESRPRITLRRSAPPAQGKPVRPGSAFARSVVPRTAPGPRGGPQAASRGTVAEPVGPPAEARATQSTQDARLGDSQGAVPAPTMRLNKRMAELGMASRREADEWISKEWVSVNGFIARMGQQVGPDDVIEISPEAQQEQADLVTIVLNKPIGIVSGQAEDGYLPAFTLVQPQNRWSEDKSRTEFNPRQLRSLVPAGRLDIDSIGLLVLTQDGRVARRLIGEDSDVEKEYLVRVIYTGPSDGLKWGKSFSDTVGSDEELTEIDENDPVSSNVQEVFPESQLERLRYGLHLDGQMLRPAEVSWQNPEQLRFVLTEGKKRQIRRMCELVGLKVVGLKRVRIGGVKLGHLPVGKWRYLAPHEKF